MNQEQKDNLELAAVMPIINDLNIPLNTVIYREQEEPDIIIQDGKKIGIEVITCHPSNIDTEDKFNYLKREKHLAKLVKQYKRQLYNSGDKYNLICVHFKWEAYWDWDNDDKILEEIDDCVNARLRKHLKYIYSASRKDVKVDNDNLIIISESNFGVGAQANWIVKCVEKKDKALKRYKSLVKNEDIDEYWLVVDFVYAQGVDLNRTDQFEIKTDYDRLYLVQYSDV